MTRGNDSGNCQLCLVEVGSLTLLGFGWHLLRVRFLPSWGLVWTWPAAAWKCSLDKGLICSVPILCPDVHFAIDWSSSDFVVSALQEELLIQLSRLMNVHTPPGSLERNLFCLRGDR